jgi:hypothetical protein
MAYTKARAEAFVLSAADQTAARNAYDQQRMENIRTGFYFLVGGWIALTVVQFAIGWIVRGFAGIPLGQDRRPDATAVKSERQDVEEVV